MKNLSINRLIFTSAVVAFLVQPAYADVDTVNIKAGKDVTHVSYTLGTPECFQSYSSIDIKDNNLKKITIKIKDDNSIVNNNNQNCFGETYSKQIFLGNDPRGKENYTLAGYYYFTGTLSADGVNLKSPIAFARNSFTVGYGPQNWGTSYKWTVGGSSPYVSHYNDDHLTATGSGGQQYCLHGAGGDNNNTLVVDEGQCS